VALGWTLMAMARAGAGRLRVLGVVAFAAAVVGCRPYSPWADLASYPAAAERHAMRRSVASVRCVPLPFAAGESFAVH
jgi:hypothetical protein